MHYEVRSDFCDDTVVQDSLSLVKHLCFCVLTLLKLTCPAHFISFCYPKGCAATGSVSCQRNTRRLPSKLRKTNDVTSKSPVGGISIVTLITTDTTLDHSQKAEKV